MVSAPLTAIAYDRLFLASGWRELWQRRWRFHAGLAGTWLLLGILIAMGPQARVAGWDLKDLSPLTYMGTQRAVMFHYIRLACWPDPLILSYQWEPIRSLIVVIPLAAVVLAAGATTLIGLFRGWPSAFLGAWWFLGLGPTSVTPISTEIVAERRMYLPLISLIAGLVVVCDRILRDRLGLTDRRRAAAALLVALPVVSLAGGMTIRRNREYHSGTGIWASVVRKQPRNARAHFNLANALREEGRVDEAIDGLRRVLETGKGRGVIPRYGRPLIRFGLGVALQSKGMREEAVQEYRQVVALRPNYVDARNNLGLVLAELGRPEEALAQLAEAARIAPTAADIRMNLGTVLDEMGRLDEAIVEYRRAIHLFPASSFARNNLGIVLAKQGRLDEAVAMFSEALRLSPDDPEIAANLREANATRAGRR